MTETGKICALTGHRDLPGSFDRNALYDGLEELIKEGYTFFCCGMARGFDLAALECLVDLKQRYHVRLEACIPYAGYEHGMPKSARLRYEVLLTWCDEKTVLYPAFFPGCFLARDRYMVEKADLLYAFCIRKTGGTAYTVGYAQKLGKPVKEIPHPEQG